MRLLTTLSLAVALTAALMMPADAGFNYGRTYPGATCFVDGGTIDRAFGHLYNLSTTGSALLECPLIRNHNAWIDAHVYIVDQNYDRNAGCELRTVYSHVVSSGAFESIHTTGTNPSPQKITFPKMFGGMSYDCYYYISCSLPAVYSGEQSFLISYTLREDLPQ
jgi:hypothetical protein